MASVILTVKVNLDNLPGAFHTPEQARRTVGMILTNRIPHYLPSVRILETPSED